MENKKGEPAPAETLMEELRRLSLDAATGLVRFTQRLEEIRDRFDGTPLAGGEGSGVATGPRPRAGDLIQEAIHAQIKLAGQLLSMGERHADLWIDRATRAADAAAAPGRRVLRLTARSPEWKLYVYNAAHERRQLRTEFPGSWTAADGATAGAAVLSIPDPEERSLGSRAEKEVRIEAATPPTVAGTYVARVAVWLDGERTSTSLGDVDLVLVVDP